VYLALWTFLAYRSPGRFVSVFDFALGDTQEFDHFWSVRKVPAGPPPADSRAQAELELIKPALQTGESATLFRNRRTSDKGSDDFRDENNEPWSREKGGNIVVAVILFEKDGRRVETGSQEGRPARFEPERTPDGKFQFDRVGQLHFREVNGRRE